MSASWNPFTDLSLLFEFHFMHNAFLAGTIVAIVAGAVGYYLVLRAQTFAGHALAHVGFAGAAGALLFGLSPVIGLLVVGTGAAIGIGVLGDRNGTGEVEDGVAIAGVFTFFLGLGLLFLKLYSGQAENAYSILFGQVLGIADSDVTTIAAVAVVTLVVLAIIGRPLLYASLDPQVAMARGVPVRALSVGFLVLVALTVAQAVQVVGVLLIFALLVTPAATAQRLTSRPSRAIALSILLALLFTWLGIAVAYFAPYSVVGFYVTTIGFITFAIARLLTGAWIEQLWERRATNVRRAA